MKKIIWVNLLLSFALNCSSQSWPWAKGVGGDHDDEGYSVTTDANNNVFVTGAFSSSVVAFGSVTLTNAAGNAGTFDVYVAKYSATGNLLWAQRAGGSSTDIGYFTSSDASGNILVTGIFRSPSIVFGTYTLTNTGGENIFLVKFDNNGNVLWAKSGGGTMLDESFCVATDASNNIIITGRFDSPTITFGTYTLTNAGIYDVYVVKYDSNGNVLWATNAGSNNGDEGLAVSTDPSGNIFVTGRYASATLSFGTYTLTNNSPGGEDIFITKYDPSGNVLWAKNAGGTGADAGLSISTDLTGNAYVTGRYDSNPVSFGTFTLSNSGSNDVFLAKYDGSGNVIWARSGTGTGNDIGWGVSADSTGVFVVGGFYNDISSIPSTINFGTYTFTPPSGSSDPMFIVRYDLTGNITCATYLTSGGDDQVGIKALQGGNAFISGDFMMSSFAIGTNTLTGSGENIFTARFDCFDPLYVKSWNKPDSVKIYPNPNDGIFKIDLPNESTRLDLYNTLGRNVYGQWLNVGVSTIEPRLPPGIYQGIITQNGQTVHMFKIALE